MTDTQNPDLQWQDDDSRLFLKWGEYFVPDRKEQFDIIAGLLGVGDVPFAVLDLACGEGLLAEAILKRHDAYTVLGLDGSPTMLEQARRRLSRFGSRFSAATFNLAAPEWRVVRQPFQAIVSSLALHHLDAAEKQTLFGDLFDMLSPGSPLIIADLIEPTHPLGWEVAAGAWDQAVLKHALECDGNDEAFRAFEKTRWNMFRHFEVADIDKPSPLLQQLQWLERAGFQAVDVFWMRAGHAIFGGWKPPLKAG